VKILARDQKQGTAQLVVETSDDLWYLHTIIAPGDVATGQSDFKMKLGGSEEKTKVVRKTVWVSVRVENTEFSSDAAHLRIGGSVVDGSEDVPRGGHHALEVRPGFQLTLGTFRKKDLTMGR
jgi:stalled ribosome rescue protein Dom34